MNFALLPQQIKAIKHLSKVTVGALFMDKGTGKTKASMELIKQSDCDYVLWLTTFTAFKTGNLQQEIVKQGGLNVEYDIFGLESLSNSGRIYLELIDILESKKRPFMVIDESLKIKNNHAKRTKRIINLGKYAKHKLILNGTPLSKNLLDIWSQMEFLSPLILNMSYARFKDSFCEYIQIIKDRKLTREFIIKYHNVDYLLQCIKPFVFECDFETHLKIHHINVNYELSRKEKEKHEKLKRKYLNEDYLCERSNNIFLLITQKLQHQYSLSKEKIKITQKIIDKHSADNVLICAKYRKTQEKLKSIFDSKVISWQKHAMAMNYQDKNVIILFDKHWDYALHDQLPRRIYRQGQTKDCYIYNLTGDVGLEELIDKNINKKAKLLDYFKKKSIEDLQKEL